MRAFGSSGCGKKFPHSPGEKCSWGFSGKTGLVAHFFAIRENDNIAKVGKRFFVTFLVHRHQFSQADLRGRCFFLCEKPYGFIRKGIADHRRFISRFPFGIKNGERLDGLFMGVAITVEDNHLVVRFIKCRLGKDTSFFYRNGLHGLLLLAVQVLRQPEAKEEETKSYFFQSLVFNFSRMYSMAALTFVVGSFTAFRMSIARPSVSWSVSSSCITVKASKDT